MSPKRQRVNNQAHLFRTKLEMHLRHYAERMKLFIAEERLSGSTVKSIKEMRDDPKSTLSLEREALNKSLKKEVAGFMNKTYTKAYEAGLN